MIELFDGNWLDKTIDKINTIQNKTEETKNENCNGM